MRVLFVGDVFGKAGRRFTNQLLPQLKKELALDFVIVNGENAAHGFGLMPKMYTAFINSGADMITLGNHTFDKKDIFPILQENTNIIRPLNYAENTIGRGFSIITHENGCRIAVVQLIGQIYMKNVLCPFLTIDKWLENNQKGRDYDILIIDFHAEATAEKVGMGHYVDGRASLVVGTHTHVPTADAHILSSGTGYITDVGMTGDYDSIIGSQKQVAMGRFLDKTKKCRLEPAAGNPTLCGVIAEIDEKTGLTTKINPIRVGATLANTHKICYT